MCPLRHVDFCATPQACCPPLGSTQAWCPLCAQAADIDGDNAFGPGFELVDAVEYWEPPLDGYGPPDNPVPAPDGTLYSAPADANGDFPSENGHLGSVSPRPAALCVVGPCMHA